MDVLDYFLKLIRVDRAGEPVRFAGTGFPVTSDGGVITARHVVDLDLGDSGDRLAIVDGHGGAVRPIPPPIYPTDPRIDLAFLPGAMPNSPPRYFPILSPNAVLIGEEVYSFGFFALGGQIRDLEQGYFAGRIVSVSANIDAHGAPSMLLPYPVLEGMSGSPVLTYHNGVKLVGLAFGNRSSRILASEILDCEDAGGRLRETIHRIVEFGVAYHAAALVSFLASVSPGSFAVTTDSVNVEGLT